MQNSIGCAERPGCRKSGFLRGRVCRYQKERQFTVESNRATIKEFLESHSSISVKPLPWGPRNLSD